MALGWHLPTVGVAASLSLALLPQTAGAQSFELFFDPQCTLCSATAEVGQPLTLYITATLAGASRRCTVVIRSTSHTVVHSRFFATLPSTP